MKHHLILSALTISALFIGCSKPAPNVEHVVTQTEPLFIPGVFFFYTCEDGHTRVFGDVRRANKSVDSIHTLFVRDDNDLEHTRYVKFDNKDGCPSSLHYHLSPDKKALYVVTQVRAYNNEFQLFKVNCETLDAKFICDCATVTATESGFIVTQCLLTDEYFEDEEIWEMHSVQIDWEGNITHISKSEYGYGYNGYQTLYEQHVATRDSLVKGFYWNIKN